MPVYRPVRGKKFPAFAEAVKEPGSGYILRLPVPGPQGVVDIQIQPPRSVVPEETNVWPAWCFQLLLVASEYCAALLEFMTWAFPDDPFPDNWAPLKAQVAEHARQLLRTSAAVPPPVVQPGNLASWQARNAHSVWAAFTYCYFHGLPPPPPPREGEGEGEEGPKDEWHRATAWLHRLVGDFGWRAEELPLRPDGKCQERPHPAFPAVQNWVNATEARLRRAFPEDAHGWFGAGGAAAGGAMMGEQQPLTGGCGIAVTRAVGARGDIRTTEGQYYPLYPVRMTCGLLRNQFKWKVIEKAPRTIAGSCGVPPGFTQTSNCALGYLVLSDAIEAFLEATKDTLKGQPELQSGVAQSFSDTVLFSDSAELEYGHLQYGYPSYLASCVRGWRLALAQLPCWLAAAAGSAAAAGLAPASLAAEGLRLELIMPRDMALLGLLPLFQQLQLRHQQQQQQQQQHQQQEQQQEQERRPPQQEQQDPSPPQQHQQQEPPPQQHQQQEPPPQQHQQQPPPEQQQRQPQQQCLSQRLGQQQQVLHAQPSSRHSLPEQQQQQPSPSYSWSEPPAHQQPQLRALTPPPPQALPPLQAHPPQPLPSLLQPALQAQPQPPSPVQQLQLQQAHPSPFAAGTADVGAGSVADLNSQATGGLNLGQLTRAMSATASNCVAPPGAQSGNGGGGAPAAPPAACIQQQQQQQQLASIIQCSALPCSPPAGLSVPGSADPRVVGQVGSSSGGPETAAPFPPMQHQHRHQDGARTARSASLPAAGGLDVAAVGMNGAGGGGGVIEGGGGGMLWVCGGDDGLYGGGGGVVIGGANGVRLDDLRAADRPLCLFPGSPAAPANNDPQRQTGIADRLASLPPALPMGPMGRAHGRTVTTEMPASRW